MRTTLDEYFKGFEGNYRHGDKFMLDGELRILFHMGRDEWCFVNPFTFAKTYVYQMQGIGLVPTFEFIQSMAGKGVVVLPYEFEGGRKLPAGSIICSMDGETSLLLSLDLETNEYAFVDTKDGLVYTHAIVSDATDGITSEQFPEYRLGETSEWVVMKIGGSRLVL